MALGFWGPPKTLSLFGSSTHRLPWIPEEDTLPSKVGRVPITFVAMQGDVMAMRLLRELQKKLSDDGVMFKEVANIRVLFMMSFNVSLETATMVPIMSCAVREDFVFGGSQMGKYLLRNYNPFLWVTESGPYAQVVLLSEWIHPTQIEGVANDIVHTMTFV